MPAVRGDGMRGLAVFISDIRNCKLTIFHILILKKKINKKNYSPAPTFTINFWECTSRKSTKIVEWKMLFNIIVL